jgi:ACS family glucarate transporter-like MFS transporter
MSSTATTGTPPEVKLSGYRWLVLIACWASFTLTSVDRSTWGPASIFVGESLAVPIASLGAFATAYYIGYVLSNAFGGFATDAFGGRIILTISLLGAGGAMMLFGATTSPVVGIAIQAVVGLFAGADYSAGIRLITSWFRPREQGLALGIFVTATSIGTAVANLVVPSLIRSSGWQASYHLFGAISIGTAILLFFTLRPGPLLEERPPKAQKGSRKKPDFGALVRNRNLLLTCLAGLCAFWGLYGFVTWSNTLMIKGHGISPETAGIVVAIFAISAIVSKPVIGFASDRFFKGARKPLTIALFGMFGVILVFFGTLETATAFIWAAPFLGIAAYGWSPLLVSLVPRLVPGSVTASASGLANAVWQLGSVFAPLAVGAVYAATGSFNAAFITLAAGPLVGMVVMFFVRERPAEEPVPAPDEKETL